MSCGTLSCLAIFGQSSCLSGTVKLSLESGWSEVVQGGMSAVVVVVGEVAGDVLSGLATVLVFGHFEFGLDGPKAGFHEGVVVTIGGPTHALAKLGSAKDTPVSLAGVLPTAVAVMDQSRGRLSIADRMGQRIQDERFGHLLSQAPAHHAARTQVENQSQISKGRFF